jgi:hypothetical protein
VQVIPSPHTGSFFANIRQTIRLDCCRRQNVNTDACGNALRQAVLPVVFQKDKKSAESSEDMPTALVIEITVKGSPTCHVFMK